jgi:hypothetical protein
MTEIEKPKRENALPLAELEALAIRVLGAALPDRFVSWLGVSRRNADRWLDGSSTYPPAVVEKLQTLAPLCDEMVVDLQDLVDDYKKLGVPENLIRLRMREFSKTLSDEPPARPLPPEPKRDE